MTGAHRGRKEEAYGGRTPKVKGAVLGDPDRNRGADQARRGRQHVQSQKHGEDRRMLEHGLIALLWGRRPPLRGEIDRRPT